MQRPTSSGFTLVELSIVLVILGLLVGGVLTGQSLIRAAELRAVSTEFARYQTAVNTFRDKYLGLPGDLTNAQSYWGVAHATPATCTTTASTTPATCNGDGNGRIDAGVTNEQFRAWQHLANAGLIEGTFSGVAGAAGSNAAMLGVNSPASKFNKSAGWSYYYVGVISPTASYFAGSYDNVFAFGKNNGATENDRMNGLVMKAEEAYNVDMKLDDGTPNMGRVRTFTYSLRPLCVTATDDAYLLSGSSANACNMIFMSGS